MSPKNPLEYESEFTRFWDMLGEEERKAEELAKQQPPAAPAMKKEAPPQESEFMRFYLSLAGDPITGHIPDPVPAAKDEAPPKESWLMKYYLSLGDDEVTPIVKVNSQSNNEADLTSKGQETAEATRDEADAELKRQFPTEGKKERLRQREDEGYPTPNNGDEGGADWVRVAAGPSGTKAQQQPAQPTKARANSSAAQQSSEVGNPCIGIIGAVPGYPETGRNSWRACNDQKFIDAAEDHNTFFHLRPGDNGYVTPQLLKAWAMVESGGDHFKSAFLSDPFQVNKPGDWVADKAKLGLSRGEKMTPEKSAEAALEWMREKSFKNNGSGTLTDGLKEYNRSTKLHDDAARLKYGDDYHPGVPHYDWYVQKILKLESEMLKSAAKP